MNRSNINRKIFGVCVIAGLLEATISAPGIACQTMDSRFALARYNANGSLDTTFDGDGRVLTDFLESKCEDAAAVAIQTDGKIVVAGVAFVENVDVQLGGLQFALARYNADGSLDTTFGDDGKVLTNFTSSTSEQANAIAIQPDGKIVVAGWGTVGVGPQFALARYNTNGSLDTTFDDDGKVLTDFTSSTSEQANAITIHPDGKIVVAGVAFVKKVDVQLGGSQFALARYNANGSLDTTFDVDGKVLTNFTPGTSEGAQGVDLDPHGKIVGAGWGWDLGSQFALARYNTNGSLDTTFDGDGKVLTGFQGRSAVAKAIIMTGNKANVAGGASRVNQTQFALARYNTNGSLDTTFDGDGKVLTDFTSSTLEWANAIAIAAGQKIVVAGEAMNMNGLDQFALARYNTNGSLDTTFDGDGKVLTDFNTRKEGARAVVIDASGRIVAAGYGGDNDFPLE